MLDAHPYSFKAKRLIIKTCSALLMGSLLTGCTMTPGKMDSAKLGIDSAVSTHDSKSKETNMSKSEKIANSEKKIDKSTKTASLPGVSTQVGDAWCRYIYNNTAAEAAIVASPTLSASTDDEGNNSANIGMNLLDFKKADLMKQSASAKCRQHKAGKTIEAVMGLVDASTRLAGYGAQHSYINSKSKQLKRIIGTANQFKNSGLITAQQVNAIKFRVKALNSVSALALEKVEKLKDLPSADNFSLQGKNFELADAEGELQDIDREIRTLDALNLSVEAGYRNIADDLIAGTTSSDDYYAKLKVGLRIGALLPHRRKYEEAARQARLDALEEENTGIIWKTGFAENSIANSLKGLKKAQSEFRLQRISAQKTQSLLNSSDRGELIAAALLASVQSIEAQSNYLAVSASINEVERNRKRLKLLSK